MIAANEPSYTSRTNDNRSGRARAVEGGPPPLNSQHPTA